MPRANRPGRRRGSAAGGLGRRPLPEHLGTEEVEFEGQLWTVRRVRGNDSGRSYRCPGCQHEVSAATAHTVVWPSEAMRGLENRRHWHSPCWDAREQRRPGGSWA